MRRRAIQMTTAAVAVAVLLLGVPGVVLGTALIWYNAESAVQSRAVSVASMVEQRTEADEQITTGVLERYAYQAGEIPARITVLSPEGRLDAGEEIVGPKISRAVTTSGDTTVTVAIPRNTLVRSVAWFLLVSVGVVAFSFLVGVMVALHQSRRLSAPLIYLAAAAEQLGAGQTRPLMEESGIEEIDLVYEELVRTADRMAGRISAERQFAADASHQLRTPLAALSMRIEEIQYISKEPEVQEEAEKCLEQVERLTGVVEDLLANSRSAAGGHTEAVRIGPIFEQQFDEWHRSFEAEGRKLECTDEANLAILAKPASLSQIIATLIENSLKYGAGKTTVVSKKVGHGVVVDVTDEGKGVPEDLTEAIFRKGVSTGGSTGIGLPLARSLAENDGGRLELTQASPPVFTLSMNAVPQSLDPEKVLPSGAIITMGSRRRRH
ncbi:ATP-binding protein [Changpingibacter yushuensis]|uniref:ATP-binding protein n=1 Tax=Changpingibacter yushuensis TaxID=2758440 RepID=UPI0015F5B0E2|nr:ATP-binding protein [Changpingibacter yushuensis]